MSRIAVLNKKEDLPPETRAVYDGIAESRGEVGGPFLALLHSPPLAERISRLGSYLRFESQLEPKVVELAALVAARELECKHEWAAHIQHGQKAGISMETIRAIHERRVPESLSPDDAQIANFVLELLRSRRVSESTFKLLFERLGARGLVELTSTIGYYAMLACTLNAFELASKSPPEDLTI